MEIHHLRIFAAVYRNNSFTRSSKQLHISQPTISEHIKNLEKELGCRLFDRLGRSIIPTREADHLYPRALEIIDDLDRLREELIRTDKTLKGEIVIGASTIPGTYILPALIAEFRHLHPEINFEIVIDDSLRITDQVLEHQLLCGVVGARQENELLEFKPFVDDELIMVAAPSLWPDHPLSPDQLRATPLLLREHGSGTRKWTENFFRDIALSTDDLTVAAIFGSTASIKEAAKAGLGMTIISRIAVKDELENNRLREVDLAVAGLPIQRHFLLASHRKRTMPLHYSAFCRFLESRV